MSIDYARMKREAPALKAALTRAVKSGDPDRVKAACKKALLAWAAWGAWPDNWSDWQRALDDVLPWNQQITLEELDLEA